MNSLSEQIYDLIVRTSAEMPEDVESALLSAAETEKSAGNMTAYDQIRIMIENIHLARSKQLPLCQDTGLLNFFVDAPSGFDRNAFIAASESAVRRATEKGILRKNSVSTLTGKNSGDNTGPETPSYYWNETSSDETARVRLLLKGGGSENVGRQYSLPDTALNAERDLNGVEKCIIDAVKQAKGKGCPPSVLSVCIGGDRATGYAVAKKGFLRDIGERSGDKILAEFEKKVLTEINSLGIGTMGLGGAVTALELFVSSVNRHPASYFVTVSQICWSYRKGEIRLKEE